MDKRDVPFTNVLAESTVIKHVLHARHRPNVPRTYILIEWRALKHPFHRVHRSRVPGANIGVELRTLENIRHVGHRGDVPCSDCARNFVLTWGISCTLAVSGRAFLQTHVDGSA